MPSTTDELLELLVERWEFVDALYGVACSKRELADEVGVSRSTARRAVRELGDAGLVTRSSGEYRLTPLGRLAADEVFDLRSLCDSLGPIAETVNDLKMEAIPRTVFLGADLYSPEIHSPYRPAWLLKELAIEADSFVYVTNRHSEVYMDVFYEGVVEGDLQGALVVDEAVSEALIENYPKANEIGRHMDQFSLWIADNLPEFGVGVVTSGDRKRAVVVVHDDRGGVELLVVNDGLAVEWALGVFLQQYERARPPQCDANWFPSDLEDGVPANLPDQVPDDVARKLGDESTDLPLEAVVEELPRSLDDDHLAAIAARVLDEQDGRAQN